MTFVFLTAAIEGRDILYDQNNKHNLVYAALEAVYENYKGDRNAEAFKQLTTLSEAYCGWPAEFIIIIPKINSHLNSICTAYFAETVKALTQQNFPLQQGNRLIS